MADVGVGRRGATTSWAAARMAAEEGPMELRNVNAVVTGGASGLDRKSTRLNSSHSQISYAVFCLKKKSTRLNSSHSQISYAVFCFKKKNTDTGSFASHPITYIHSSNPATHSDAANRLLIDAVPVCTSHTSCIPLVYPCQTTI